MGTNEFINAGNTKFSLPTWLNSILITILVIIASASFAQNRSTQKSVDLLTIQVAVLTNQIETQKESLSLVGDNKKRLDTVEKDLMPKDEILRQFELIKDWVNKNYIRKSGS